MVNLFTHNVKLTHKKSNDSNWQALAISPLDSRYYSKLDAVSEYFSDFSFNKTRIAVEIEWLIFLAREKIIADLKLSEAQSKKIKEIYQDFSMTDYEALKLIESQLKHDLKAVEYFIKDKLIKLNLARLVNFIHFGLTSEDINSCSYGINLKGYLDNKLALKLKKLQSLIISNAKTWQSIAMLARTHGQPASPTTLGKEIFVFAARLEKRIEKIKNFDIEAKFSGAVGNYNSLIFSLPQKNWSKISEKFLKELKLKQNQHTTQIEPSDYLIDIFNNQALINSILIDFCRDIWSYISLNYFELSHNKKEVGSSTMPHKINPIEFENAEGNLGLANSLFNHFSNKLPISRLQRDLSDSTVKRNIGSAFAFCELAIDSIVNGLQKLSPNKEKISADLQDNYAVLTEALQTELRIYGIDNAYDKIKAASRGKLIDKKIWLETIAKFNLPAEAQDRLAKLTPENYIGNAKTKDLN